MSNTFNRKLYRIRDEGKLAGVCAGVAEYTGLETWLVRVIWFSGVIFSGGFFVIAYIALWFILDAKEKHGLAGKMKQEIKDQWARFDNNEQIDKAVHVKRSVYQAGEPPRMAFRDISQQFKGIEQRIQEMESYVTSNEYRLKREISKL